jgi:hypothetical protein
MGPNIGSRAQDVRIMVSLRLNRALTKAERLRCDVLRRQGQTATGIADTLAAAAPATIAKAEGRTS